MVRSWILWCQFYQNTDAYRIWCRTMLSLSLRTFDIVYHHTTVQWEEVYMFNPHHPLCTESDTVKVKCTSWDWLRDFTWPRILSNRYAGPTLCITATLHMSFVLAVLSRMKWEMNMEITTAALYLIFRPVPNFHYCVGHHRHYTYSPIDLWLWMQHICDIRCFYQMQGYHLTFPYILT